MLCFIYCINARISRTAIKKGKNNNLKIKSRIKKLNIVLHQFLIFMCSLVQKGTTHINFI